jgi:hypothetical protein
MTRPFRFGVVAPHTIGEVADAAEDGLERVK